MFPKSIRWRLPLSYAGIALLATLCLGAVLLTTLRGYYAQREFAHLQNNSLAIGDTVAEMYRREIPQQWIRSQLESLAFLAQARIQILDVNEQVIVDSGDGKLPRMIALGSQPSDVFYQYERPGLPAVSGQVQEGAAPWEASMNLLPLPVPPPLLEREIIGYTPVNEDQFTVAVFGTPFGFGFNGAPVPEQRSDQQVRAAFFNEAREIEGYIELSDGPAYGTEIVEGVGRALLGAGVVAVILAAGVGGLVSRQMSAPLLALAEATQRMAEGNLSAQVSLEREDEFGLLARTFNHMARRMENTVTTLRRFIADAAHELHTPITALHANLELAATEDDHIQRLTFIQRAQEQLKRLEALTNGLLDLSRFEADVIEDERRPVNLVSLVWQVSELYASRAEQAGLNFQFDAPPGKLVVQVNEGQLRRVVGNLLDNAIKFTPQNGAIHIGLRHEGEWIRLWVQDTGIGIPTDDLPYVFSRFHRARNAAAYPGSGLGLAIIKAIVEGHGGQVKVESSPGSTRFSLELPAAV